MLSRLVKAWSARDGTRRYADRLGMNRYMAAQGPPPGVDPRTIEKQKARKEAKRKNKEEREARLLESLSPEERGRHIREKLENEGKIEVAPQRLFKTRTWCQVTGERHGPTASVGTPIRIVSWNLLAQSLVRRELFPGSDCLKWKDREPALAAELKSFDADILALQECDKLEESHQTTLEHAGYSYRRAQGSARKKHGLVIAWRTDKFDPIDQLAVRFDEHTGRWGRPTRVTSNCALLVALRSRLGSGCREIIIATTHLHWHPKTVFERARQGGIILTAIDEFQERLHLPRATCILCGDLNAQPSEALYKLLSGQTLSDHDGSLLEESRMVHHSIDKLAKHVAEQRTEAAVDDDEQEGQVDPDKELVSIRQVRDSDGIIQVTDLVRHFRAALQNEFSSESAYGRYYADCPDVERDDLWRSRATGEGYAAHEGLPSEPIWTNFTPGWRLTLDYIFILQRRDDHTKSTRVLELLKLLKTGEIEPGLPRLGVTASDHMAVGCTIAEG